MPSPRQRDALCRRPWSIDATLSLLIFATCAEAFAPQLPMSSVTPQRTTPSLPYAFHVVPFVTGLGGTSRPLHLSSPFLHLDSEDEEHDNDDNDDEDDDDDDDDDDEIVVDPYVEKAASEFRSEDGSDAGDDTSSLAPLGSSSLDWGGAYGKLRERLDDVNSGKTGPSNALFRLLSSESPNEAISKFVSEANPEVVGAMSGAVGSLLGGLSSPTTGVEVIVKANGEKLGNLCFQLQFTGYMFRNAEYVLALKEIMNLRGSATLEDYRDAFDSLDTDGSGYVETNEIEAVLSKVYDDNIPPFEVKAFLDFFDANQDGRISWEEFEKGLGAVYSKNAQKNKQRALPGSDQYNGEDSGDEYEDLDDMLGTPEVSGTIKVELKNGKFIEVEAEKYIDDLKAEAEALKQALRAEKGAGPMPSGSGPGDLVSGTPSAPNSSEVGGIAGYIASLEGDVKSLTEGISPEVVDTMKMLIKFVLKGGAKQQEIDPDKEMEIPGSALQQLALWQLVLGYRLREAEATGDYRNLLSD